MPIRGLRQRIALAFVVVLASSASASAHPAGTASVDRYLYFERTAVGVYRVAYRLDFAEAAAPAELAALDENHDGDVTPEEQRRYLAARIPQLVSEWDVEVNGAREVPTIVACHLDVRPGQSAAQTMQIDCELQVEGPASGPRSEETLEVRDRTFVDRPGIRILRAGDDEGPHASSSDAGPGTVPRIFEASFRLPPLAGAPGLAERRREVASVVAPIVVVGLIMLARWIVRRRSLR